MTALPLRLVSSVAKCRSPRSRALFPWFASLSLPLPSSLSRPLSLARARARVHTLTVRGQPFVDVEVLWEHDELCNASRDERGVDVRLHEEERRAIPPLQPLRHNGILLVLLPKPVRASPAPHGKRATSPARQSTANPSRIQRESGPNPIQQRMQAERSTNAAVFRRARVTTARRNDGARRSTMTRRQTRRQKTRTTTRRKTRKRKRRRRKRKRRKTRTRAEEEEDKEEEDRGDRGEAGGTVSRAGAGRHCWGART